MKKQLISLIAILGVLFSSNSALVNKNTFSVKAMSNDVSLSNNTFVEIAAGTDHNLALDSDGNLWAWGRNDHGQVGNGTTENVSTPIQIMKGHKFKKISAGNNMSAAIDEEGYLYTWGAQSNMTASDCYVPTLFSESIQYNGVLCSYDSIQAATIENSDIYFGYVMYEGKPNGDGERSASSIKGDNCHTRLTSSFSYVSYYTDSGYSSFSETIVYSTEKAIADIDGNFYIYDYSYNSYSLSRYEFIVYTTGEVEFRKHQKKYSYVGIVGKDTEHIFFERNTDITSLSDKKIVNVSVRKIMDESKTERSTAYLLDNLGKIHSVGGNGNYNLLGTTDYTEVNNVLTPVEVESNDKFIKVSAGKNHVLALDENGKVYSWGNNAYGQLGHGDISNRSVPTKIDYLDTTQNFDFTAIAGETFNGTFNQYNATSYNVVESPKKGELILNSEDGSFTYTPTAGEYGNDTACISINYDGNVVEYQVNIFINRKPYVSGCTTFFNVDYGGTYSDRVYAKDADSHQLTYEISSYPSKGNIVIDSTTGDYTYSTKLNTAGEDSFEVTISDGYSTIYLTISVHIESRVQVNDKVDIILDNTNLTSYEGNMNALELDGDEITYSILGQPSKGTLSIDSDGNYSYIPNENEYGEDTFTLRATDGKYPNDVTYNVILYSIEDSGSKLTHEIRKGETLYSNINTVANNCTPKYSICTQPSKGQITIDSTTGEYTYIPNDGTNGLDSFEVLVEHEYGSYKLVVTVYQNTSPDTSLVSTDIKVNENVNYYGSISSTDIDTMDLLRYKVESTPRLGSISVDENTGDYIYYPNPNVAGYDNAVLSVTDGINTVLISLNIKIESVIVTDENISKTISQNTSLTDTIVATDKDGDNLTYKIKSGASNGVASIDTTSGKYTYIPKTNFYGSDTFIVEVTDGTMPKLITIDIFVNRRPIAGQISLNFVTNGSSVVDSVDVSDLDGDTLTYTIGQSPKKGSINLDHSTGMFAYTPNTDAAGDDTFTIIASDGCDDIVVTVNVHNETEFTVTASSTNVVVNQGKSTSGQIVASDRDGDTLSYQVKTSPTKGTLKLNSFTGAWTYDAKNDVNGTDSFVVTISDGVTSRDVTYNLTINIPPKFNSVQTSITTKQNTSYTGNVSGSDGDGDSLTYSVCSNGTKGSVTINSSTGRYVYKPNTNAAGDDSFVLGISDGNFVTEIVIKVHIESTVSVSSGSKHVTVNKNSSISGSTGASDADGDELTYSIYQQSSKGSASVTGDGTWTYFSNNGAGDDSFIIKVTDGNSISYVTIYVHISSTPTVGQTKVNITVGEGGSVTESIDAYDEDGDELTYSVSSNPTNGTVSINAVTGEYIYRPNSNTNASSDSFVISVSDGTNTKYITVNVKINNTPTCNDSNLNVEQGGSAFGVISGSDNENDKLTYSIGSQGKNGTVSINSSTGEYTYTTNDKNYYGMDSFTVVISDGYTSTTVVVNVNITQNQMPNGSGASVVVDAGSSVNGKVGATDPENDQLTYSISVQGEKGTAYIDPNTGEFTYSAQYNTEGYDCFIVTVSDGFNTRSYLVEININWVDVNDSWAIPTTIGMGSATTLSIGAVIFMILKKFKKR